ncbi:nestin-like isoform X2 [Cheilinus undulatus]|uniref:nestin-like isoform X2 n=1 Tax=Cheilinus undulatus TaxID=241271 RepID=UPI001BD40F5C|nr:nestin-like isoform X2 [Cheilinus undulatus]
MKCLMKRSEVWADLLSAGQVEVRAGLSDGSFLLLKRTDGDLARMMKRLVDGFLDDRETLSSSLLTGLLRVRAADQISDVQVKTVELNKLLQSIINLPHKFSQSEAVLDFFTPSAVDRIFKLEQDHTPDQVISPVIRFEHQEVVQTIKYENQEADQIIKHENQEVDHTIKCKDQGVDPTIKYQDVKEVQTIRYEDQEVLQIIRHEDQEVVQTIRHEDQAVVQTIRHEDQAVVHTIRHQDQEVVQNIINEDQEVVQTIRHEVQEVDQINRHEEQELIQTIRHEEHQVDQTNRHQDQELNQTLRHEEQEVDVVQDAMVLSEVSWCNGFCLANTETILFDLTPPTPPVTQSEDSASRRDDGQTEEAELQTRPPHWLGSLHLLHALTQETDILE